MISQKRFRAAVIVVIEKKETTTREQRKKKLSTLCTMMVNVCRCRKNNLLQELEIFHFSSMDSSDYLCWNRDLHHDHCHDIHHRHLRDNHHHGLHLNIRIQKQSYCDNRTYLYRDNHHNHRLRRRLLLEERYFKNENSVKLGTYLGHGIHHDHDLDHRNSKHVVQLTRFEQCLKGLLCLILHLTNNINQNKIHIFLTMIPIDSSLGSFIIFISNCCFTFTLSCYFIFVNPNFSLTCFFIVLFKQNM